MDLQQARPTSQHKSPTESNDPSLESARPASTWREASASAARIACSIYSVSQAWVPAVAGCTFGIIAVESKFGRSPRYHLKCRLHRLLYRRPSLAHYAPNSQGPAQVDRGRAEYLSGDRTLNRDLDLWARDGATEATALGLAKAISLHYPRNRRRPSRSETAIIVITHNTGWMSPRVARLQEALVRLDLLAPQTPRNGFAGPQTLAALDLAASRFSCPKLSEAIQEDGRLVSPQRALTHPDLLPDVRRSTLFQSLHLSAQSAGQDLDEPLFPDYRIRHWHTGWISSIRYADAVLTYVNGLR